MQPIWKDTQNYTAGRDGTTVDRIVIHYIVGTLAAADATFASSSSGVSAHYGIGEGAMHQYVTDQNHAGNACDFPMTHLSIAVEHSADGTSTASSSTSNPTIKLSTTICQTYRLQPHTQIIPNITVVATDWPASVHLHRI